MKRYGLTEAQIRLLLAKHEAVSAAAAEIGCSERSLRERCQALRMPSPSQLLGRTYGVAGVLGSPPAVSLPSEVSLTFVIPDMHFPYHDKAVWATNLKAIQVLRPRNVVIIGDALDAYPISFHPKSPTRKALLQEELADANAELDCLAQLTMGLACRVVYVEGNHEFRLERYLIQQAPALYGMITMPELLKIKERNWEWVPYQSWLKIGKIAYSHEVGSSGKNAPQQTLAAFGNNIVFGHSHRGGLVYGGTVDGERHVALNVGWGGDLAAIDYTHKARTREWQHGFGLVEQDATGAGWCQFVPIIDGRCVAHGQVIRG